MRRQTGSAADIYRKTAADFRELSQTKIGWLQELLGDPRPGWAAQAQEFDRLAAAAEGDKAAIGGLVVANVLLPLAGAAAMKAANGHSKVVNLGGNKYPESAQHIRDAQAAGHPATLTIDRGGAADRRREALSKIPTKSGSDRDEYPPAMFKEGGKGSSVRHINPSDNRGSGSCIGAQCRGLSDGTRVKIQVTD